MSAPSRREPNEQNEPQICTEPSEEAVMPAPRSEAPSVALTILREYYLRNGHGVQQSRELAQSALRSTTTSSASSERALLGAAVMLMLQSGDADCMEFARGIPVEFKTLDGAPYASLPAAPKAVPKDHGETK